VDERRFSKWTCVHAAAVKDGNVSQGASQTQMRTTAVAAERAARQANAAWGLLLHAGAIWQLLARCWLCACAGGPATEFVSLLTTL
jgi:hypothetical protein